MEFFVLIILMLIIDFLLILIRRDLVLESITGSVIAIPFALFEMVFIPFYWNPHSIGQFSIGMFNLDLESFFFCVAFGGIASICYEIFLKKKIKNLPKKKSMNKKSLFKLMLFSLIVMIFLSLLFHPYYIYVFIFGGLFAFIILLSFRIDLAKNAILGALLFSIIYIISLYLVSQIIYPDWIENSWNKVNLLFNIYMLGIPLEEYLWAFTAGLFWAPLYEIITNRSDEKNN